ncbi:MAG: hypothetical protein HY516_03780 [Candidatus Aenigmarchaeota archaeon]|nr:hypothetical protein [Candidatus Aenigmarchaeota archaeon]
MGKGTLLGFFGEIGVTNSKIFNHFGVAKNIGWDKNGSLGAWNLRHFYKNSQKPGKNLISEENFIHFEVMKN